MKQEWQSFYLLKFHCKAFNILEIVLAPQVFCLCSSTFVAKLHPRKYKSYVTDRAMYNATCASFLVLILQFFTLKILGITFLASRNNLLFIELCILQTFLNNLIKRWIQIVRSIRHNNWADDAHTLYRIHHLHIKGNASTAYYSVLYFFHML
jgi:hypothetical protein